MGHSHSHDDPPHGHPHGDFADYHAAVAAYRQSFPSAAEVCEKTPDPAVREMLGHLRERGIETCFDRFDAQKPHCTFGLAGVCCKNCNMGPCRITRKSPRGVCGADADLIAARNLLRWVAAGVAAHGARGREVLLELRRAAAEALPIAGEAKLRKVAAALGLDTEGRSASALAGAVADILLDDLSRSVPAPHRILHAFAPAERIETWRTLGVLPVGAYHEVFEALHRTTTGTDGDWRNVLRQMLRLGLAFSWGSVLGSSLAMDVLYGPPARSTLRVNLGAIREGFVNLAVHGHSPVLVSEIVKASRSPDFLDVAARRGAQGIQLYGICCSGLSAMYRYGNVIPLANAMGAELVLGTGALDLWVADVQDVYPSIMGVAACFRTTVVTTSDSGRMPGAEHYGFDHAHANLGEAAAIARTIVARAIASFAARRDVPVHIPAHEIDAEIGFSLEALAESFGGIAALAAHLKAGDIRGVVNLVGCNNPRVVYEQAVTVVAGRLIAANVLVLTNGCASFPLLKLGFCRPAAADRAGQTMRALLRAKNLPPVLHMGECLDNARASATFRALADAAGHDIREMPFAFASPEWSNEKGVGAALAFRLLGVCSYHCVHPPVQGAARVMKALYEDTAETLGAVMVVQTDPDKLADRILADLAAKRCALGWVS